MPGENLDSAKRRVISGAQKEVYAKLEKLPSQPESIDALIRESSTALFFEGEEENIAIAAREIRYQAVVSIWSSIEVLLKDQLIHILNTYPGIASKLIEDESSRRRFDFPKLTFKELADYHFNLQGSMGELLLRSRDISDLHALKSAIKAIFGADSLFAELNSEPVRLLNAQRHLIVHRRGIVDEKYLATSGESIDIGTHLEVTPLTVAKYFRAAITIGVVSIQSFATLLSQQN